MSDRRARVAIAPIEPRGLTREHAAVYCGCETERAFDDWVARGIVPGPIPGTHRWDRKAIDMALDRASGIQPTMGETTGYADWKRKRAGAA